MAKERSSAAWRADRASETSCRAADGSEHNENSRRFQAYPSAEAISAARDLGFEALIEHFVLAESYSRSAAEAAWRGDRTTVELHLVQLRLCVIAAIQTFKELGAEGAR
jgi:hypothetical protein